MASLANDLFCYRHRSSFVDPRLLFYLSSLPNVSLFSDSFRRRLLVWAFLVVLLPASARASAPITGLTCD